MVRKAVVQALGDERIDGSVTRSNNSYGNKRAESRLSEAHDDVADHGQHDAAEQELAVVKPFEQRLRHEAAEDQRKEVKRQNADGVCRIDAETVNEKQREPTSDGPFIAELKEEQETEEHRRDATQVGQHLAMQIRFALADGLTGEWEAIRQKEQKKEARYGCEHCHFQIAKGPMRTP